MRGLWRPRIEGTEHVPRTGGVILASNHLSFIDSFVIPLAAPRPVRFVAKDTYFTRPGVKGTVQKAFFEAAGAVPIDRDSPRAAQDSLDIALLIVQEGGAFGIYPEGTRSRDGRLYRGRTGVAWVALTAGVPVVPVGLIGTEKVQPVDAKWPTFARVTVRFGAPLTFEHLAGMPQGRARREATDAIMDGIWNLTGQERVGTYNERPPG